MFCSIRISFTSTALPMLRYRLRTLLLLTILGPPALAGVWWAAHHDGLFGELEFVAATLWGIVLLAVPFLILGHLASRVASSISGR